MRSLVACLVLLCPFAAFPASAADHDARLLRFADVHEDRLAFVYAGDLWVVPSRGGEARRLTSHEGLELFPKFSPDGRSIAFSAEYTGSRQVYVIPVEGGTPRQLTWYNDVGAMPPRGGFDYRVLDWTRDGKHVVVRANRLPWGVRMGRYFLVPVAGGLETPLPIPEGGGGMLSPDGGTMVYTPIDREWRTWKRHRGGRAQDVWTFDLESLEAKRLTTDVATDNQPVWVGDTVYFTSDRQDGRLNLFAIDPAGGTPRRVTEHADFDVLWPSAGPRRIVYECGGHLYLFDPANGGTKRVSVQIPGDFPQTVPRVRDVSGNIGTYNISPTGKRAVFGARGEVFTVPAEHGEVRNVTRTPAIREITPVWSPDGRWIAYLSDRSGEYEIYVRAHDGSGEERRVTRNGDVWRFPPLWSPDSKKLAFGDTDRRLRYTDVDTGEVVDVDRSRYNFIFHYRWSPDSRWLVYTKQGEARMSSIYLHALGGETHQLTDDFTSDFEPVFDPKGRYLYFLSDRDYQMEFSGYEFNYFYVDPTRVYAATLAADGPALLRPKSDEEEPAKEVDKEKSDESEKPSKKKGRKKDGGDDKPEETTKIDVEGFANRVVALPVSAGNYDSLAANEQGVLFITRGDDGAQLQLFNVEDEETSTVLEGIQGYELSHDGKQILYNQRGSYGIAKAAPKQKAGESMLDLGGMRMRIDPKAEWKQIFHDGWRIVRDWFYDSGMHGLDWAAMRELYAPLVEHVSHRADLDYIFGELGGELNAGHFYVNWGDFPRPERVDNGLLGAELVPDVSGYPRIETIFPGENWHPEFRSPLTEPGVDVREGDLLLAIDGRSTAEVDNVYALLEGKAGTTVTLTVNGSPSFDGAREASVRPVARETNLRYLQWVRQRREMVDRLSGGRIGYIHLPNTSFAGNRELRKFFYPQAHKDALIFDVRYNGGGFIPDRMIELLTRERLSYWARRGIEPDASPQYAHEGPKACLINGYSSSGGDAFPYYFRKAGLGPLIGTRTWGGLIGLSGNPGLIDGGSLSIPTFRFLDTEGNWAVENVGVRPDIEVIDRPDAVARGEDPTLERAIEYLLKELERSAPERIEVPEPPRYER